MLSIWNKHETWKTIPQSWLDVFMQDHTFTLYLSSHSYTTLALQNISAKSEIIFFCEILNLVNKKNRESSAQNPMPIPINRNIIIGRRRSKLTMSGLAPLFKHQRSVNGSYVKQYKTTNTNTAMTIYKAQYNNRNKRWQERF